MWIQTYFEPVTFDSIEISRHFVFCHGNRLAIFSIEHKNCILWGASFELIKPLATLLHKQSQGFHGTLVYYCYVCLAVCSYKTPKSLLRLRLWARKTPGSISTRAAQVALPAVHQRYTTAQNHSTCQLRSTLHKLTGSLASLDLRQPYTSRILSQRIASQDPPRPIPSSTKRRALNTNTQGIRYEKEKEGANGERFGG